MTDLRNPDAVRALLEAATGPEPDDLRAVLGKALAINALSDAAPDLATALADALDREARLREIVRRIPNALNQAFAAGMEECEGGSARRQSKCMEPVEALRADARAALEKTND